MAQLNYVILVLNSCILVHCLEHVELMCNSTHKKGDIIESIPSRNKGKSLGLSEKKCQEYVALGYPNHIEYVALRYPKHLIGELVGGGVNCCAKQFPHMAALGYGDTDNIKWQCGGSLISQQHILTAAHCLRSLEFGEVKFVRLGVLNLKRTDYAEEQDFRVIQHVAHPGYNPPNKYHDIAILKLHRPVMYSEYVPACLHTTHQLPTCHLSTAGWGASEYDGPPLDRLQNVDLRYYTNANCQRVYRADVNLNQSIIDDLQICAGGYEKDACQGDSGGPLQYQISGDINVYYIVGVTSFGKGCATGHIPGVYTRVSHYVPWIEQSIWS